MYCRTDCRWFWTAVYLGRRQRTAEQTEAGCGLQFIGDCDNVLQHRLQVFWVNNNVLQHRLQVVWDDDKSYVGFRIIHVLSHNLWRV